LKPSANALVEPNPFHVPIYKKVLNFVLDAYASISFEKSSLHICPKL
jgi:hypothetical protein